MLLPSISGHLPDERKIRKDIFKTIFHLFLPDIYDLIWNLNSLEKDGENKQLNNQLM